MRSHEMAVDIKKRYFTAADILNDADSSKWPGKSLKILFRDTHVRHEICQFHSHEKKVPQKRMS